ncbi:hypothetical protein AB0H58_32435 [Nocardia neocaledoniensis]|uniref:hypothetical protein n=1 Tax=Nocardia neocaledoniensis TaxID=236511 RepID=UPI00340B78B4
MHTIVLTPAPEASALAGQPLVVGTCRCGGMAATPPWTEAAAREMYRLHTAMAEIDDRLDRVSAA